MSKNADPPALRMTGPGANHASTHAPFRKGCDCVHHRQRSKFNEPVILSQDTPSKLSTPRSAIAGAVSQIALSSCRPASKVRTPVRPRDVPTSNITCIGRRNGSSRIARSRSGEPSDRISKPVKVEVWIGFKFVEDKRDVGAPEEQVGQNDESDAEPSVGTNMSCRGRRDSSRTVVELPPEELRGQGRFAVWAQAVTSTLSERPHPRTNVRQCALLKHCCL